MATVDYCATTLNAYQQIQFTTQQIQSTIWATWTANSYQSTSTTVWQNWQVITGTSGTGFGQQPGYQARTMSTPPAFTEQELAALRAESQRRQDEADAATAKATELLESHLDEEQKKSWRDHKVIYLETARKNRYRISHGKAGNVHLMEKDKPKYKYCAHPIEEAGEPLPVEDVMLVQLLCLKYSEDEFLKIANRSAA